MGHIFAATLPFADFIYYDKTRNYVQIYAQTYYNNRQNQKPISQEILKIKIEGATNFSIKRIY